MAGGGGTRLWPLSRRDRPKQLLPLVGERSMFQIAIERLAPMLPMDHIVVVTGADMLAPMRRQVPELPPENFIAEPMGRDTAPAIGLGAIHIQARDPEAIIAVLTADHYIADTARFRQVLRVAAQVAADGSIATLGIRPDRPYTGFGYVRQGALWRILDGVEVFEAREFTEKPDLARAETFVRSGEYSWNSGMFVWQVSRVMAELERQRPALYRQLQTIAGTLGGDSYADTLAQIWPETERISIDYAVMEGASNVRVIPVEMGWSDIGSWSALYDLLGDGKSNVIRAPEDSLMLDTHGSLIISERLVATIGLDDLIVVDTPDVLLVCRRDRAQDVKSVVDWLGRRGQTEYL